MQRYILRRLALFFPTLLLASLAVFLLMRALPGNAAVMAGSGESPRQAEHVRLLEEELGLTKPLAVQYLTWLGRLASGELGGRSLETREPVLDFLVRHLPVTLLLVLYVVAASLAAAVPLGVLAAMRHGGWVDHAIRVPAAALSSVPGFALALLALLALVLAFGWSPPVVYRAPWESPAAHAQIMALPVFLLAMEAGSHIVRVTRSGMLEVLRQDYIRTARGKGLGEWTIAVRHGLPNALVPAITVVALQAGGLMSGAVVLEAIFGVPGLGRALVQAAAARDYPVAQGIALVLVSLVLALHLAVDVLQMRVDRRAAAEERA